MAVISITQYVRFEWPIDIDVLALLFEAEDDGSGSTTSRTVVGAGYSFEVDGADLTVDGNGMLLSGTITGFRYYVGGDIVMAMSGTAYDVEAARDAYENDTPFWLIGPNDSFNFDASAVGAAVDGSGIGTFHGTDHADSIVGSEGEDELIGYAGNDTIYGLGGDDLIWTEEGDDLAHGGEGNDTIYGYLGNDTLYGNAGRDLLQGNDGNDLLLGGDDNDYLIGGAGRDTLDGGAGNDIADYTDKTRKVEVKLNGANDVLVRVNGVIEDTIRSVEGIAGGSAGDKLTGDSLDNFFQGYGGKDTIDGGAGFDTVSYFEKTKKVEVTLNGSKTVTVKVGGKAEDKIKSVEAIVGGSGNDRITGDSKGNQLAGAAGNDTISGGGGNDTLIGNSGKDVLTGGKGNDFFWFNTDLVPSSADTIKDFAINRDKIVISAYLVESLGGTLDASEFRLGKSAQDADDFIIYDRSKGKLYYDADGNGAGQQVLIATLSNKAKIDHEDFLIV